MSLRSSRIGKFFGDLIEKMDSAFLRGPAILRRFGVPLSDVDPERRGLIILQIDGLSYERMQRAMARRQLPFLRKLVKRRRMIPHRYLSELPTSTPAFQAGMFYGNNDEIPGFHFYDKYEKYLYRMGLAESAYRIEKEVSKNPGLLRDGSVFSSVFTGDANSSLFIFSTLLAPNRWKFVFRIWDLFILTILNSLLIVKIFFMVLFELLLALWDGAKWMIRRGWVAREISVIAIRIGLTVFTRELITISSIVDIYRRVPIIYVNYLGYDEHAHIRNPDSSVALWTLRGIDRCIRRIYKASLTGERHYDLYVLSDHGQCATIPFELAENESLAEFLQGELADVLVDSYAINDRRTLQLLRTVDGLHQFIPSLPRIFRFPMRLYANHLYKKVNWETEENIEVLLDVTVVSTGPVAYIYWNRIDHGMTAEEIEQVHPGLIDKLSQHPSIGFISMRMENGSVLVKGPKGWAELSEDSVRIWGSLPVTQSCDMEHVLDGIRKITCFRRSGDICVWGGGAENGCISYGFEFGAHSGWTDGEISSFVLAPAHVDFDFSKIRRHNEFYDFFYGRYGSPIAESARIETPA